MFPSLKIRINGKTFSGPYRTTLKGAQQAILNDTLTELRFQGITPAELQSFTANAAVSVEADDGSLLASGEVLEAFMTENNTWGTVILADGLEFAESYVSVNIPAAMSNAADPAAVTTVREAAESLLRQCSHPVPLVSWTAENKLLSRPLVAHDRTVPVLQDLVRSVHGYAFYSQGGIHVMDEAPTGLPTLFLLQEDLRGPIVETADYWIVPVSARGWPLGQIMEVPCEKGSLQGCLYARYLEIDTEGEWHCELFLLKEAVHDAE